jgi:hypothetical protein
VCRRLGSKGVVVGQGKRRKRVEEKREVQKQKNGKT